MKFKVGDLVSVFNGVKFGEVIDTTSHPTFGTIYYVKQSHDFYGTWHSGRDLEFLRKLVKTHKHPLTKIFV